MGPLIHPDHRERVLGYIRLAREEGAEVVAGTVPDHLAGGNFVAPTLLLGVRPDMRVWQEEIFGPVLAVMPFADEEEAIRLANGVRYGLAAYVWTNDLARAHRVSQALEAGMVWVNSHNVRDLRIPFGGMKESGIGREGGHYSFEFYTETQVIHVAIGHHHSHVWKGRVNGGVSMAIRTGAQYIAAIDRMKANIWVEGKKWKARSPNTRPSATSSARRPSCTTCSTTRPSRT